MIENENYVKLKFIVYSRLEKYDILNDFCKKLIKKQNNAFQQKSEIVISFCEILVINRQIWRIVDFFESSFEFLIQIGEKVASFKQFFELIEGIFN